MDRPRGLGGCGVWARVSALGDSEGRFRTARGRGDQDGRLRPTIHSLPTSSDPYPTYAAGFVVVGRAAEQLDDRSGWNRDSGDIDIPDRRGHPGDQRRGDPSRFPDPQAFILQRPGVEQHIAFERGTHFCLGAPAARLETQLAIGTLSRRFPGLRIAPDQVITHLPALTTHTIAALQVLVS